MRVILTMVLCLMIFNLAKGQNNAEHWYSESNTNGIIIQNSLPKGGPYTGPIEKFFNHSYLVFFSRVTNNTNKVLELSLNFRADSFSIPNSPGTFVKLFLPPDTMTMEKLNQFSYGMTELVFYDEPTGYEKKINPGEDCLFYVVALFYQTNADAWSQERGGNRAELVLKGQELYYKMPPQIDALYCGQILPKK